MSILHANEVSICDPDCDRDATVGCDWPQVVILHQENQSDQESDSRRRDFDFQTCLFCFFSFLCDSPINCISHHLIVASSVNLSPTEQEDLSVGQSSKHLLLQRLTRLLSHRYLCRNLNHNLVDRVAARDTNARLHPPRPVYRLPRLH